jgi:hypothetical protein
VTLGVRAPARTLRSLARTTFETSFGPLDIVPDPAAAPPYSRLRRTGVDFEVESCPIRVASREIHVGGDEDGVKATAKRPCARSARTPRRRSDH